MDTTRTAGPWVGSDLPVTTPERYTPVHRLGRGGMGEVWEVHDTLLDRMVAYKLSLREDAFERFTSEARITARLQHPGVLALYDLGVLPDKRAWYTMRLVPDGRTLRAAWREMPADTEGLRARLRPLLPLANTLAFAHAHGVTHLDVKPDNVLIGAFGEVLVLDWGLARTENGPLAGGTPGYMAPELRSSPAADVWALGVMLREGMAGGQAPEALTALVAQCAAVEPTARPTAQRVAHVLEEWLDDVARRQRAEAHVARADRVAPRAEALRAEAARLSEGARRALDALPRLAPVEAKLAAWDAEEEAARLLDEAAILDGEWEGALTAALAEADLHAARERLADRVQAQVVAAVALPDVRRGEAMLRAQGLERHRRWLDAPGTVSLTTEVPASVRMYRCEPRRRRHEEVFVRTAATPLCEEPLAPGSWVFVLEAEGCAPVRYPVRVGRAEHWEGAIRLPLGELGPDDVFVPGGWFRCGGDPLAPDALPAGRRWVDDFVIRRFPVTAGQYAAWLEGLAEQERVRFQPQDRTGPDEPWRALWSWTEGRVRFGRDALGATWRDDLPVTFIDLAGAEAFVADEARRTGLPWRLPRGLEVEKAARGVDGRLWPWGDGFEPTWACTAESLSGPVAPRGIHEFPMDESPYGVRGLAGNVRTWCSNVWTRDGEDGPGTLREVRGGAFVAAPAFCRPAGRVVAPPDRRLGTLGVRLCRAITPGGTGTGA